MPIQISRALAFLFLLICTTSCDGQVKKEQLNEKKDQPNTFNPWQVDPTDHDPYFIETNTVTNTYGPQSITRNMIQDRNGNFWFATWEGIVQYNPKEHSKSINKETKEPIEKAFTNFTNKDGLRRYHAFSVLEDRSGIIWFGTIRGGLYRYDAKLPDGEGPGRAFANYTVKQGLANDMILCFHEDTKGHIWIGTSDGVSVHDPKLFDSKGDKSIFTNYTAKDGLTNTDVNSIAEDKDGKFWFGTRGDVFVHDPAAPRLPVERAFIPFKMGNKSFENVRSIIEDKNGNIWFGGNNGLWRYNPAEGEDSFTQFTKNFVGYIYEDSKGNIWFGSVEDNVRNWILYRYDASYEKDEDTLKDKPSNIHRIHEESGQIFGIMEDSDGNIWFGTERGVCRYDDSLPDGEGYGKSFNYFR